MLIVWFTLPRKSYQPEDGSQLQPKHVVKRSNVRTQLAMLIVWFTLPRKSDQPEDGS